MRELGKLIVRKRPYGGYDIAEGLEFSQIVSVDASLSKDLQKEICERIAAALNDETEISEADLNELEALAKRVEDRSEYGGGLILSLVNMYRNVKMQPKKD